MKTIARFATYRPPNQIKFTNDRYLLFKSDRSKTSSFIFLGLSTLMAGWFPYKFATKLVAGSWTGMFGYGLGAVITLKLWRDANLAANVFVSEMSLLSDGQTLEVTNCAFNSKPQQISLSDITSSATSPKLRVAPGQYIILTTKLGQEYVLSSQGIVADKELLKCIVRGDQIDVGKDSGNIIDV